MSHKVTAPNPWMILPFALLLGAIGTKDLGKLLNQHALSLLAISVGSVFFGAAAYIGNGSNFMVKAVADQQKIRTPTFPGFVLKFTLPFLLPMLPAIWLIFFRG
jgi:Na+/H+ antiporter NhaD/arsenite permease-like protein